MDIRQQVLHVLESYWNVNLHAYKVTDRIGLTNGVGKLRAKDPIIRLLSVRANGPWPFINFFGDHEWINVDPSEVDIYKGQVHVPGEIMGMYFTEAEITYLVGYEELPKDVELAIDILVKKLGKKKATSYSIMSLLDDEIATLMEPYKGV